MRPLCTAVLLSLTGLASAATLNVPGSYATIQAGINAASNGDTVLVAPGTYFEAIDFLGRDITVQGAGGAAQTIIDGQSASTVVLFVNGESSAAVLSGFTIRNGRGAANLPGAVLCTNSDPTLLDCVFEGNVGGPSAGYSARGGPGAIFCSTSSPIIQRCAFVANVGGDGVQSNADGGAGAFYCVSTSAILIRDCLFDGNMGGPGLGSNSEGGPGVLRKSVNSALAMEDCVLRMNRGGDGNGAGGPGTILVAGGCSFPCVPPGLLVQGSCFSDNVGGQGHDGGPGAVKATSGAPIFLDCTFSRNQGGDTVAGIGSAGGAGVVECTGGADPMFESCAMSDNVGGQAAAEEARCGGAGAIYAKGGGSMLLDRCIIQRNRGGLGGPGVLDHGGTGGVQVESSFRMNLVNSILVANVGAGAGPVPGGGFEPGDVSGVGGAEVDNGWLRLTNCTVAFNVGGPVNNLNNDGAVGGLLLNQHSWLINSIVWGNTGSTPRQNLISSTNVLNDAAIVDYCCLGEPYNHPGLANLVTDPLFVNAAADDYRLACDSPCIDAGVSDSTDLPDEDFEGDPRPVGDGVDIGADESTTELLGVNYCVAASNSSGVGAVISAEGRPSVFENCVTLMADGIPGTPGLFFYGPTQIQVTFGDGLRCIGGALRRLPPSSSVGGVLRRELDLPTTPISGGSVWNFQAWYRDPAVGGAGFNTSDGLEVSFQP